MPIYFNVQIDSSVQTIPMPTPTTTQEMVDILTPSTTHLGHALHIGMAWGDEASAADEVRKLVKFSGMVEDNLHLDEVLDIDWT